MLWKHRAYLAALAYGLVSGSDARPSSQASGNGAQSGSEPSTLDVGIAAESTDVTRSPLRGAALPPPSTPEAKPTEEVPRTPTPLSEIELAEVLRDGHRLAFGDDPSDLRLAAAWAHLAYEHGRGRLLECNNFGNLSVRQEQAGAYFVRPKLKERRRRDMTQPFGRWGWLDIRFYAFPTPVLGARAYWRHLADHYGKALAYFSAGAPKEAAHNLAIHGWATAPPERYEHAIADLYGEYMRRLYPVMRTGKTTSSPP